MSNNSHPKPTEKGSRIDGDHDNLNAPYNPNQKHKFEGWPILWILIVIFLIAAIIWYTDSTSSLLRWIDQ